MLLRIQKTSDGSFSALIDNKTPMTFLHASDIAAYIDTTPEQVEPEIKEPDPVTWKEPKTHKSTKAGASSA